MPNHLTSPVRALRDIQKIDIETDKLRQEFEFCGKEILKKESALAGLKEELSLLKKTLDGIIAEKKEKEEKIRENKERIEKDGKRLSDIKSEKQYKALTKEIGDAEKANKLLDMELTSLTGKIEDKKNELKAKESGLEQDAKALTALKEEFERKKAEFKNAIEAKTREKEEFTAKINPQLLKKYENTKAKRKGFGVVNVKDGACQGCFIQIPPQVFIELKKNPNEIITCPHCHRILYCETQS